MSNRGFEVISEYKDKNINLPKRQTKGAAGYDFEAAETVVIPSMIKYYQAHMQDNNHITDSKVRAFQNAFNMNEQSSIKPVLVPTGIKAYMNDNEYLELVSRSSLPIKKQLILPNSVGIIDSDYYNNKNNEGHIMFQFINFGATDVTIKKGERIGQGIFKQFLLVDDDNTSNEREGGFGSTDK